MISRTTRASVVRVAITSALAACSACALPRTTLGPTPMLESEKATTLDEEAPPSAPIATGTEELWIIASDSHGAPEHPSEGSGIPKLPYLRRLSEDVTEEVRLPLWHTDVRAAVAGHVATVDVQQQYLNSFADAIDVEYVFPLPRNAAVSDFTMTIGARHIRAIIRERKEAQRIYAKARHAGHVASLLTEERPNLFKQAVANIDPGKEIDVEITYFNTLSYRDGEYELRLPMMGPPPIPQLGASEINFTVDIDAGMRIETIHSPSHRVSIERPAARRAHVELEQGADVADEDFVVRFQTAGNEVKTGLLTHRDQRGGFFTLLLQPPKDLHRLRRQPMELVFVIDCSGKMAGWPIAVARTAILSALRQADAKDTFQILRAAEEVSYFEKASVMASPENIERATDYISGSCSGGGGSMTEAIRVSLQLPGDPSRQRLVTLMTAGSIGSEPEMLVLVEQQRGKARIFGLGIGPGVNHGLLDEMARSGRGAVAFVDSSEDVEPAIDAFFESVTRPALTDVQVDWGAFDVTDVYPDHIPDLFVGRPLVLTGRFRNAAPTSVTITGSAGDRGAAGTRRSYTIAVSKVDLGEAHPALPGLWARARIAALEDAVDAPGNSQQRTREITDTALDYGILSSYTAFLGVDAAPVPK